MDYVRFNLDDGGDAEGCYLVVTDEGVFARDGANLLLSLLGLRRILEKLPHQRLVEFLIASMEEYNARFSGGVSVENRDAADAPLSRSFVIGDIQDRELQAMKICADVMDDLVDRVYEGHTAKVDHSAAVRVAHWVVARTRAKAGQR